MSKVVHLSDTAHAKAKSFCKENAIRMSDWVAMLIEEAIAEGRTEITRSVVPKKKPLKRIAESAPPPVVPAAPVEESEEVPAYASPPFWERRS